MADLTKFRQTKAVLCAYMPRFFMDENGEFREISPKCRFHTNGLSM